MTEFIIISILLLLFCGFLYWAYLPDYRRDPREFWRTLIGMPFGMFFSGIGYPKLNEKIKKWAIRENEKHKTET